jgi:hypothetical protein
MPPPFLTFLLVISTSALTPFSRCNKVSSQPWPPRTRTCFSHPSRMKVRFAKLIVNRFLPDCVVLQWHPATGKNITTPNTNEIVVFFSFFQCGFGLSAYDFFCGLLDHYKIELFLLNPILILQITVFIHLCEVVVGIPSSFSLFKNYFFFKY